MQIFDDVREATFKPARKKMTADYEVIRLAVCKIKHCQSKQGIGCGVLVGLEDSKLSKYIIITSSQVIQEDNFSDGVYEVNFSKATKEKTFDLKNITKLVRHVASGLVVIFIDSSYSGLVHNCGKTCSILSKSPLTIADYDQRQQLFCYVGNQCYIVESHGESEEYVLKAGSDKSDTTAKSTDAPDEIPNGTVVLQGADKNVKAVGILNVVDDKRMVISPIWLKSSIAGILGKRKDEAKNGATMTDREEQPSLQSAIGKKSEKPQNNSCQSSSNSKEQPNPSEVGLSHSSGHKPRETTHKMSHSLDHTGSPDCLSVPPCPRSKSLETSDNKNTPNQQRPSAQQHGLSTVEQAPSSSEALNRRNHEQPNGASHTEHQSTIPATDGETLNPVNSEMPADGTTVAGISSSSSTQEPPVVTTTTTAAAAAATTTGEPQNFTNSATFVDGSPRGHQASTVSSVTARAPAVEPQNPSSNESSVDGVTGAGSASLSSNQESSPTGSASADGESQNPANNESPVDGAAAADHTAFSNQEQPAVTNGDSQNPERVAPENGVNSSSLQQLFNTPATTAVPPNEGESSLHSLTGLPTQVEPENTAEDTTTTQETTHREEAVNNYEHFLVLEKIHGNRFLQDKLAIGLDRTCHRVIKTWEHLACTKEISAPLEVRLRCKINSENSCTLMLFDVLTSEFEDKTVKDVIDALTRIKRNDAKKIIIDVYPNAAESSERFTDFSASPANSKLLIKMATLLDQQSRVNQNWRNLGQQFQLSDERLKEIEYGQSAQVLMQYIYTKKTDLKIGAFYDEVKKLNRKDVLKKMNPYIVEEGSRDKLMKDVIELESDAMRSICVCLNNPNRVLKNWRHLAKSSVLGIPEDIYKDCEPGKLKSPTEALFEWIFAEKDDLTVGQLCSALRKIDRNDLVRDLRGHFEQNSSE